MRTRRHLIWSWRANGWFDERANAYLLWMGNRWEEWEIVRGDRLEAEKLIASERVPIAWKLKSETTEWKWFPHAH